MNVIAYAMCLAMLCAANIATAYGQSPAPSSVPSSPLPSSAASVVSRHTKTGTSGPVTSSLRNRRHSAPSQPINGPYASPDATSLVVYDYDPDYLYPILVRTSQETHLVFAPDEEVVGVYLSDTGKRWLEHTALTKRDVFIEARLPGLENAATIITSRRRYELDLRSSDDGKTYQRVSWHYLDTDAKASSGQASPFGIEYPGNVPHADGHNENDVASASGSSSSHSPPGSPHIMLDHANFDYRIEGSAPFTPVIVFDDGRFTYLQFPHQAELPAILLMDEMGEAEIASFIPLGNDFYEVQQTATYGLLLKRGRQEVRIFNGRGKGCGIFGCDAAQMKNIYGKP
ncbi:TrbG/VirB9 family P-type conjugative transfer protein [Burkholderia pseudomallei]|uniref:TrbG/VirB9 family P-type conjugative transfer protein n=1 Tax=Burkholderia pseudomallei TaxID=28450 RepID=UPI00193E1464|nr:TrbG/VirB9 family P-type conjugative transfer protein [Burkholderia pseudomallei]MBO7752795.1 TrbG/VirB9 family P-type conjugative transfer protein [Burkholderia pseudomallei]MBO7804364.1 TrbG/VirB9 family P-type conjugative transfer protein [Burkholderia pseudomallei]QRM22868.1 TrbG/VirB9 family P-type conjugative transfer protein [Burkholderia pseudomallei]